MENTGKAIFFMAIACLLSYLQTAVADLGPEACDLWVLAGQSNMQGYGMTTEPSKEDARIMMLNMDNRWMVAREPLHRIFEANAPIHREAMMKAMNWTSEQFEKAKQESRIQATFGVGPGLFFARELVDNGISAVGLIASASGGTSMDQWSPALKDKGDNSLYGAMLNRINRVGGKIKGMLWYQGEGDADANQSLTYESKMLNFIDSVRRDVGDANLPIIYVQIARIRCNGAVQSQMQAWEKIRDAQLHIMSLRKNAYMVTAIDLPMDDIVHISYDGQRRLGHRMAEIALTYVYNRPNHGRAIDIESIEAFNNAKPLPYIKLRLKGVTGKLHTLGRPCDFDLVTPPDADQFIVPFRTDFDPNDPSAILVHVLKPMPNGTKIIYGQGLNPYMNILDEKDVAVPAFGPREIKIQ